MHHLPAALLLAGSANHTAVRAMLKTSRNSKPSLKGLDQRKNRNIAGMAHELIATKRTPFGHNETLTRQSLKELANRRQRQSRYFRKIARRRWCCPLAKAHCQVA